MAGCDAQIPLLAWRRLMRFLADLLRSRVLSSIVTALGVTFIAAGLLTYTSGTDTDLSLFPADSTALASPATDPSRAVVATNSPAPTLVPSASSTSDLLPSSAAASATPTGTPPVPTPLPTPSSNARPAVGGRVATRVVISALNIDLPVVRQPGDATTYPLCDVAMYIQDLSQPGYDGATYLYAHARVGMFLPLLDQSTINGGRGMLGMIVQVYTSDDQSYVYQISEVRRHQTSLAGAIAVTDQELWLQTSEGPRGTPGKLQVIARPLSNGPASVSDAHPTPRPVVCG